MQHDDKDPQQFQVGPAWSVRARGGQDDLPPRAFVAGERLHEVRGRCGRIGQLHLNIDDRAEQNGIVGRELGQHDLGGGAEFFRRGDRSAVVAAAEPPLLT